MNILARSRAFATAALLCAGLGFAATANAAGGYSIQSLNTPNATFVTSGDAVRINIKAASTALVLRTALRMNGANVTSALQPDGAEGSMTGTVQGLQVGDNVFELFTSKSAAQSSARLVVVRAQTVSNASAACAALKTTAVLPVPNTVITTSTLVAASGNTPEHCNVVGTINAGRVGYASSASAAQSVYTYAINWQARLPTAWNGRFYMPGGGGSDGSVPGTTSRLSLGYAAAANDSGHSNAVNTDPLAGGAVSFGTDYLARVDFAYNAIDSTTQTGKALANLFYSKAPTKSYFEGCSMGGREAMMVTQRFPTYFDGVVVGDPGFRFAKMLTHAAYDAQLLGSLATSLGLIAASGAPLINNTFTNQDLQLISKAVLDTCDGLDGLVDGMVNRPLACTTALMTPALNALQCPGAKTASCLYGSQIDAILKLYAGPKRSTGQATYFPWMWDAGIAGCTSAVDCNTTTATNISTGWRGWKIGGFSANPATATNSASDFTGALGGSSIMQLGTTPPMPTALASEGVLKAVLALNFDLYADSVFATTPQFPTSSVDLFDIDSYDRAPFRDHGSKMIITQPQSGGPFSPYGMVDWYQNLNANMGGTPTDFTPTQSFARLFMQPGAQHCGGGPSTSTIDAFSSVVNWVENGVAPDQLIGTAPAATPFPGRTRPLCPFPSYATYTGSGSIESAANFVCTTPPAEPSPTKGKQQR